MTMEKLRGIVISRSAALRLLVVAATAVAASWSGVVSAQELDHENCNNIGRSVVIETGERLDCDLFLAAGDLEIEKDAVVTGDVGIAAGDARIDGAVFGNVAVTFGDARVSGDIGGDVFVSGNLELLRGASIDGDATVLGEIVRAEGSDVRGDEVTLRNIGAERDVRGSGFMRWLMPLVFALVTIGLAALFSALAVGVIPETITSVRESAGGPIGWLLSIVLGLLAIVLFVPLSILLLITVFGPFVLFAAYAVGTALGTVGAGEVLGGRIVRKKSRPARAALGTGLLAALLAVPLYFGMEMGWGAFCGTFILANLIAAWALGASIRAAWSHRATASKVQPSGQDVQALRDAPDDVVERADEAVRTLSADARRMTGEASDGSQPSATTAESAPPPTDVGAGPSELDDDAPSTEGFDSAADHERNEGSFDSTQDVDLEVTTEKTGEDDPRQVEQLTDLAGMTPIYVALFDAARIVSIEDLAQASIQRVETALSRPGVRPVDAELIRSWIEAARGTEG